VFNRHVNSSRSKCARCERLARRGIGVPAAASGGWTADPSFREDWRDVRSNLTVALTGPTGTFGFDLMPLLQADERIARVVGIARRPFDPNEHGWTRMTYRRGDVRDLAALEEAFQGAGSSSI
jgi:hypothetical protein